MHNENCDQRRCDRKTAPQLSMDLTRRRFITTATTTALITSYTSLPSLSAAQSAQQPDTLLPASPEPPPGSSTPFQQIDYRSGSDSGSIRGELLAERETLGRLILDRFGVLTAISPDEFVKATPLAGKLSPASPQELADAQMAFMPSGSKSILRENFVVCYNTTDAYARWNSDLFENLYRGFQRFWKTKGFDLTPPRFPLVALLFESKQDYIGFASQEFQSAEATLGYYNQETNRLASYDLTGTEESLPSNLRVQRSQLVQQIFSRPEAERTVATIIHEACHQLAFNCGLQTRLGASPLWLSEGLATFFETPDLASRTGLSRIGKVNRHNYYHLSLYLPVRPEDSLTQLVTDDNRLKAADSRQHCYAEAWGLTHFLLQTKPKEFVAYLHALNEVPIGYQPTSRERLELFRSKFGEDMERLDKDFLRHLQRLR